MLNLWIGYKEFDKLENFPDMYFDDCFEDWEKLETDFSKRVITTCSDVQEVLNYKNIIRNNGMLISPRELSTGAKSLLLLMYTDVILNANRLCKNCEPFLKEIADTKDVTLITTRYFNPFATCDYKEVLLLNTNKVLCSDKEFCDYIHLNDITDLLYYGVVYDRY